MNKKDRCEYCDGIMEERIIRARFRYKTDEIYVDNVPAWVCSQCHETYYDAPVYKRLEQIAKQRAQIERTIAFPLAEYEIAAVA